MLPAFRASPLGRSGHSPPYTIRRRSSSSFSARKSIARRAMRL
jgi:hypothetical protein